jgi:hypothetical protein
MYMYIKQAAPTSKTNAKILKKSNLACIYYASVLHMYQQARVVVK